jgi:hypothetical protein
MNFKNILYAISCISFTIILGAAVYEHIAVWPNAFAAAPRSLTMFQGEYPLHAQPFWLTIHPVTLILFITCLAFHWKTERRNYVLITFSGYVLILISTAIFFVPTLLSITKMQYADIVNEDMTRLGQLWITLSLIRGAILLGLSCLLIMGLTKSAVVLQRKSNSSLSKSTSPLTFASGR